MKKAKLLFAVAPLFALLLFFVFSIPIQASILDDIKSNFSKKTDQGVLSVESNISLAPGGDVEKDNEIDAGDIVRFTYTITNTTDQEYSYGTLKTNIDRKQLNFIHNIHGTSGLIDDNNTIEIPNLQIDTLESIVISFDARLNYYNETSKTLSTEAELLGSDKKSVFKSERKQISTKKAESQELKMLNIEEKN